MELTPLSSGIFYKKVEKKFLKIFEKNFFFSFSKFQIPIDTARGDWWRWTALLSAVGGHRLRLPTTRAVSRGAGRWSGLSRWLSNRQVMLELFCLFSLRQQFFLILLSSQVPMLILQGMELEWERDAPLPGLFMKIGCRAGRRPSGSVCRMISNTMVGTCSLLWW